MNEQRRLAAILAADMVGYSRLMEADESGTISRQKAYRAELIDPKITEHNGRIVKTTGDGMLVEFASVVDAVNCAVAIQRELVAREADVSDQLRLRYRIGINIGDIVVDGDDIFGDGVNVAARIEGLCQPDNVCLSGTAYDHVNGKIDLSFENLGEQRLKNIAKPIQVYCVKIGRSERKSNSSFELSSSDNLQDKPSIAVLPFVNMSDDPEQEFFADGLVDDIINTLSKLSGLRVIARNSTFVYKGMAIDIREVSKQLGVRYVLEGSVRSSSKRIRITVQLINSGDGSHIWAERYDRIINDIFTVQDEITMILATEMQVKFTEGEQARLRYTTTNNIEAWTYWVRGLSYFRKAVEEKNAAESLSCWKKALTLDPNSATLNAMVGFRHYSDARFGWWDDRETAISKMQRFANRALEIDPDNPDGNTTSSLAMLLIGRYEEAAYYARRATQLAPGSADALAFACFVLAFCGYPEEAIVHGENSLTLNPNYPGYYLGQLGLAYRFAGNYDKAITFFLDFHSRDAGFGLSDLVIIYQEMGRLEEARKTAVQLLHSRPDFTVSAWADTQFHANSELLTADVKALLNAGLPMN